MVGRQEGCDLLTYYSWRGLSGRFHDTEVVMPSLNSVLKDITNQTLLEAETYNLHHVNCMIVVLDSRLARVFNGGVSLRAEFL